MTKLLFICLLAGLLCTPALIADSGNPPTAMESTVSPDLPLWPHSGAYFIPYTNSVATPALNGSANLMITPRPDAGPKFAPLGPLPTLPPSPIPGTSPHSPSQIPILTDPNGYGTENNWLACIIVRRIVDFGILINPAHTKTAAGDIKVTAQVDADAHQVHVDITSLPDSPLAVDLHPDFAWDARGYAPLAAKILESVKTIAKPEETLPDGLTLLLNPTGAQLARQDVKLSALLRKYPAWAAAHEEAALLLVTLAIRDHAGEYSDSRRMLCRATAHLALAEILRGQEPATWAGKIADAAIRALSGREVDALAKLDTLDAAPDCPEPARAWISALRLRAKDDWRLATPHPKSPLLLKIAWFEVLSDNLDDLGAITQFKSVDEFTPIPDWGRAVLANKVQSSVGAQNSFCKLTLEMEVAELAQVLTLEGTPLNKNLTLGQQLADPLVEQLFSGPHGDLRVVGPDMFKDSARQHLSLELNRTYWWIKYWLGLEDEAEAFRKDAWKSFVGMRLAELTGLYEKGADPNNRFEVHLELEEAVQKDGVTWHPWEIAAGDSPMTFSVSSDEEDLKKFYRDGLPFGTVYQVPQRRATLDYGQGAHSPPVTPRDHDGADDPLTEYMRNSPWCQAHPVGNIEPFLLRARQDPLRLQGCYPPPKDLLAMAPSSFPLFARGREMGDLIKNSRPWWDYDLAAIHYLEGYSFLLDDATYDELLQKKAKLDPDAYFQLGALLREEGRDDEAATTDRKGFDLAHDQVNMSNRVGPLVNYYHDHGNQNDALLVAKRAADTQSQMGLMIYCDFLEKAGQLTEASHCAQTIFNHYHDHSRLDALFAAHPDVFHDQNDALVREIFPNGLKKVDFSFFKEPPSSGCQITGSSTLLEGASLKQGDVIVALDSYSIESTPQYDYVRAMKNDPHMELIIWRNSRYMIAHTSAPDRRFGVPVKNYVP